MLADILWGVLALCLTYGFSPILDWLDRGRSIPQRRVKPLTLRLGE